MAAVIAEVLRAGRILIRNVLQVPTDVAELVCNRFGRFGHRTVSLAAPGERNGENDYQRASNLS
jgi:hypothetical protein